MGRPGTGKSALGCAYRVETSARSGGAFEEMPIRLHMVASGLESAVFDSRLRNGEHQGKTDCWDRWHTRHASTAARSVAIGNLLWQIRRSQFLRLLCAFLSIPPRQIESANGDHIHDMFRHKNQRHGKYKSSCPGRRLAIKLQGIVVDCYKHLISPAKHCPEERRLVCARICRESHAERARRI
jgi:hypothetical protein